MHKLKIKGHVTDFGKSVHVPDLNAYIVKSRKKIMFMNNSGYLRTE